MNTSQAEAKKLNKILQESSGFFYEALSKLGKKLYYPKGILAQSAEASAKADKKLNATIGTATLNNSPMIFDFIQEEFPNEAPKDIYPYAPVSGRKKLREEWKNKILKENPSLENREISNPIATNGITHGLSIMADLFCDEGDIILTPDMFWENYSLVFEIRRGAKLEYFSFFNSKGGFNVDDFSKKIDQFGGQGKVLRLALNFPNNPTGYNLYPEEANNLVEILIDRANKGYKFVVFMDDAYYGLFFDQSFNQSLFSLLAGKHENILAAKLDGATKEYFVWGFRLGFVTYGVKCADPQAVYSALETKTNGIIRATLSSGNHSAQTIIEKALLDSRSKTYSERNNKILAERADVVGKETRRPEYAKFWDVYPFNSGYFMCLKLKNVDAEQVRQKLLENFKTGTIAMSEKDLRIAFSSAESEDIPKLVSNIAAVCGALAGE